MGFFPVAMKIILAMSSFCYWTCCGSLWMASDQKWWNQLSAQAGAKHMERNSAKKAWGSWWTPSWPWGSLGSICQQWQPVWGGDPSTPLWTGAATPALLGAVTGSSTQNRRGFTGPSAVNTHRDDEGTGALHRKRGCILGDTQNSAGHGSGWLAAGGPAWAKVWAGD